MSTRAKLLAAFEARLGPFDVVRHTTRAWHSATFSGERHVVTLELGAPKVPIGFAADIADAEIKLKKGFVADVAVTASEPGPPCRLTIEILTIDE